LVAKFSFTLPVNGKKRSELLEENDQGLAKPMRGAERSEAGEACHGLIGVVTKKLRPSRVISPVLGSFAEIFV
jgi:hypothetical protein